MPSVSIKQELVEAEIKTENNLQFPKSNKAMGILKKYNYQWNLFIHDEYKCPWINVVINPIKEEN